MKHYALDELAASLKGRQSKDGLMCLCPAHNDKNPSLSITEKDGKILVFCHAGCSQDQVIDALKSRNLWPIKQAELKARIQESEKKVQVNLDRIADEYQSDLSQETMTLLCTERMMSPEMIKALKIGEHLRRVTIPIQNKNGIVTDIRGYLPFSKRKAGDAKIIPKKEGDASPKLFPQQVITWITKAKQLESLGNLENLGNLGNLEYQAAQKSIVLCEGETDALALLSNGFMALTNTCGAGTWNDDFTDQIKELDLPVFILMDNDLAGESGALKRADSLVEKGVTVSIAKWPDDLPTGWDVTDELKLNGPAGIIKILNDSEVHSDIVYMDNVVAEPVDWLFKPFIAIGKTSLLEGEPGIGKSYLSLYIASLVSIGAIHPIDVESNIPKGKVLLMSAEDGLADTIKPRLEKMVTDLTQIFAPKEIFTLDEAGFEKLEHLISREKPILVIIDPLTPFLDGKKDINHSKDMRPFFKSLAKLAVKYSCAILVTRHLAKSKDFTGVSKGLGSIDIAAAVRSILQVTSDKENSNTKRVEHIKCNIAAKGKPFGYVLENNMFKIISNLKEVETEEKDPSELERAVDFLKEALSDGPTDANAVEEAAKQAAISKSTLNRAKKILKIKSKKMTDSGKVTFWKWSLAIKVDDQESQESQESIVSAKTPFRHFNETDADRD